MTWITVIWSATAALCLTLAGLHFLVWAKSRESSANLLFAIAAASAAACAGFELALMHAQTPAQFGEVLRWFQVPIGLMAVSLFWFVRQYLRAERLWLARLIAGVLVVPSDLSAQTGLPPAEPGFTVLSWDSGGSTPGKFTTAMARTPDGYLWLGTQVGLIRFDGVRFVTITTNTTPALGDNRIRSLLVDGDGVLWIATQGGTLSRRQNGEFLAVPLDSRLRGNSIESLTAAEEGGVWLGTDQWGLVRVSNGTCDFSNSTSKLTPFAARSLVRLANGEWWAMAQPGLMTLNRGTWQAERFGVAPGILFWALAPTRRGSGLWLATEAGSSEHRGARLLRLEDGKVVGELAPYPWPQHARFTRVTSIIEDGQGRVWVATQLNGVFYWQAGRGWHELKSAEGQSYTQIQGFLADGEGLLWMATRDEMLHRIAERQVATVPLPAGRDKEIIFSACMTRDGTLWAGTEDAGVFRFGEGDFWQVTNGLHSLNIGTLFEDSRSNLWVGTQSGLSRWSGARFQPVSLGTTALWVYAMCEDRQGNLWVGNGNQVVQLHPDGHARVFGRESGLGDSLVLGMAEDAEGRIYASQETSGLYRLKGDLFERFAGLEPDFGANGYLLPDEEGALWVATQSKGLHRLHQDEFRSWSFDDGLPNDYLRSVIPDDAGNLWFSASKGIFGCSRRALLDYQRGKTPPVLFWRLGVADGMEGAWTSGSGQPVAARSADGRLWFPNRNVVAVIDPEVVTRRHLEPPPLIEEVMADGMVVPRAPDGTLQLLSGARRLEVHYTCPDLDSPELLRFRHRLEGLDDHWVEVGNQRVAYYVLPEPGDYRFRVMVRSHSGEWTECEAPLALSVLPRWWEMTPVRILGLLSIIGLVAGTTWRVGKARHGHQLEKLELELAREKERQRAEQSLRESAVFNQQVLASLDHEIAILDRSGRIIDVNKVWKDFARAHGDETDWVGTSYLGACKAAGSAGDPLALCVLEGVRSVLEGARDSFEMEYPCKSPGRDRFFLIRAVPLRTCNGGAVVSRVEITKVKEAELEAQTLRRDLAHISRVSTMGLLSSALAHELNQPLGAILRNAEAGELFLQQNPPDYGEMQAILADIRRDDQRAAAIIERMRSLFRRRESETGLLSVQELLEQVIGLTHTEFQARQVAPHVEIPDELPPVRGDRVQLQQVILNLLVNAMEAMDATPKDRRRLVLAARRIDEQSLEVAVSDAGQGISAEQASNMFKPFNTCKPEGLGIGLAISKTIIESHGGRIWAENNLDGGATFRFTLKVAEGNDH